MVMQFKGLADFSVSSDGTIIRYRRGPHVSAPAFRSALIDQVLPRAVAHRGNLVLHAGTIVIAGQAVCLAGPSGVGKSTMAVAFANAGYTALADDAVRLTPSVAEIRCTPSYAGARLWPDSVAALGAGATSALGGEGGKQRCRPAGFFARQKSRPLSGILLLDRSPRDDPLLAGDHAADAGPLLRRLGPAEALAAIMSHAFVLDDRDTTAISRLLAVGSQVAARVPVHLWSYPSGYTQLQGLIAQMADMLAN
jgi:hypothetical protein